MSLDPTNLKKENFTPRLKRQKLDKHKLTGKNCYGKGRVCVVKNSTLGCMRLFDGVGRVRK